MSDIDNTELLPDEAPSGEWVETCDVFQTITEEEMEAGREEGMQTFEDLEDVEEEVSTILAFAPRATGSPASALRKARELRDIMLLHGVPEVSIELVSGRPSPYGYHDAGYFVAEMSHHVASRYSTSNTTPALSLVKRGRSDLPGPLCNGYGGFDLTYRIITFGYANHPGEGGPHTVKALSGGTFTIPKDSARRYAWGTEFEGGITPSDWDKVLTNPRNGMKMTMREFMGRCNAALEEFLEIHETAHLEHSTWTSRKPDRAGYSAAKGIAEKAPYRKEAQRELPIVNLANVREQFVRAIADKKVTPTPGVRQIQRALNRRYKTRLKLDGVVGPSSLKAWGAHEDRVGVVGRRRVPDRATLSALGGNKHFRVGLT